MDPVEFGRKLKEDKSIFEGRINGCEGFGVAISAFKIRGKDVELVKITRDDSVIFAFSVRDEQPLESSKLTFNRQASEILSALSSMSI